MIINRFLGGGAKINGLIEDYLVAAGENISAGDFVQFINDYSHPTAGSNTSYTGMEYSGYAVSAGLVDSTHVFVAFCFTNYRYLVGAVLTISNGSFSSGTITTIEGNISSGDTVSVVVIDSTRVFVAHTWGDYRNLYGTICTISGTTITAGTNTSIRSNYNAGLDFSATLLDSTHIFVAYRDGQMTSPLHGTVCTVSGTSISHGDDTVINSDSYAGLKVKTVALNSNKVFIAHCQGNSNRNLYSTVCTISGTTIIAGTSFAIDTASYSGTCISLVKVTFAQVFIAYTHTSQFYLYGVVCNVVGTSITIGALTSISNVSGSAYEAVSAVLLDSHSIFIAHGHDSSNNYLYGIVCTISGTSITSGVDISIDITIDAVKNSLSVIVMDSSNLFILYGHGNNYTLYRGSFLFPSNLQIESYVDTINGIAKTAGIAGETVSVYVPE